MNIFYQFLFVLVTTGFFVIANVITSQWAKTGQHLLWIPIFLSAIIGYTLFGLLIRQYQNSLSIAVGVVDALLVVVSILIGVFILKDVVNLKQVFGLIFACLAVMLLV